MSKVSVSETEAENRVKTEILRKYFSLRWESNTGPQSPQESTLPFDHHHCSTEDKKLLTLFYLKKFTIFKLFATGYFVQEEGIRVGSSKQTFERSLEAARSKESRPSAQIGSREFF